LTNVNMFVKQHTCLKSFKHMLRMIRIKYLVALKFDVKEM